MENNWEPRVGQKVVCLKNTEIGLLKKGDEKTVLEIKQCSCGLWLIRVGTGNPTLYGCECLCYKQITLSGEDPFWDTRIFAPISEQYADMTSEIAKQFIEHPDKADQPIKILETVN